MNKKLEQLDCRKSTNETGVPICDVTSIRSMRAFTNFISQTCANLQSILPKEAYVEGPTYATYESSGNDAAHGRFVVRIEEQYVQGIQKRIAALGVPAEIVTMNEEETANAYRNTAVPQMSHCNHLEGELRTAFPQALFSPVRPANHSGPYHCVAEVAVQQEYFQAVRAQYLAQSDVVVRCMTAEEYAVALKNRIGKNIGRDVEVLPREGKHTLVAVPIGSEHLLSGEQVDVLPIRRIAS